MDLLAACRDPNLFRPWFRDWETWASWRTFIAAAFGLPMTADEQAVYTRCTGRARPPTHQAEEAWLICGRRSGKSFILSLIATYLACFRDWQPYLSPGERGTVMLIAADRRQSRVCMRYIRALLGEVALLKPMVQRSLDRADDSVIDLVNKVTIEVHTASFRSVRGYTVVAALCDEIAFWRDESSANPDVEILEALRPAMATVPGSMLLAASSPYSRRGALYEVHRRHWAAEGAVLVWQADTRTMNPTIPLSVITRAFDRDAAVAASEWSALFRSDLESYVDRAAVEACIEVGCRERGRVAGVRYMGFIDPSGGRQDSMTMAIGHKEHDVAVLDLMRERVPPFDPAGCVADFAADLRRYGVTATSGDRFGGEWVSAQFRKHGVVYRPADKPKSDLYRELLPALNSRKVSLLDHAKLVNQLVQLERRVGRGGRDSIDHAPNAHDDIANAVAGVLVEGVARARLPLVW